MPHRSVRHFPGEVGVDVSEAQQTAEELEAETKFTSPCCHRCGSTSSVVMATLVMREGLLAGPKASHSSRELVLGRQLCGYRSSFHRENCLQALELSDDPELKCIFSFSPTFCHSLFFPASTFLFLCSFSPFPFLVPYTGSLKVLIIFLSLLRR